MEKEIVFVVSLCICIVSFFVVVVEVSCDLFLIFAIYSTHIYDMVTMRVMYEYSSAWVG